MNDSKHGKWIVTEPMAEEHGHEAKDGPYRPAVIRVATNQPVIGLPILCRRG